MQAIEATQKTMQDSLIENTRLTRDSRAALFDAEGHSRVKRVESALFDKDGNNRFDEIIALLTSAKFIGKLLVFLTTVSGGVLSLLHYLKIK